VNSEMQLKLNKLDEFATNEIEINNEIFGLLERTNQVQQNDSKSINDKFEKLIEITENQQTKFKNETNNKIEGIY